MDRADLNPRVLPAPAIGALRAELSRMPSYVRGRGRDYFLRHRVGPLAYEEDLIRAVVRGTRQYRSAWRWSEGQAQALCTCPVAPECKHAYALGLAILADQDRDAEAAGEASAGSPAQSAEAAHEGARGPRADQAAGGEGSPVLPREGRPAPRPSAGARELEALRNATSWERTYALHRLVAPAWREGIYFDAAPLAPVLEEEDPDLLCWMLAQEIPKQTRGWLPPALEPFRDRPDLAQRAERRAREAAATELARWAQLHAAPPARSLRVVFGLECSDDRPLATLEARISSARLRDEPRSLHQILQAISELNRDRSAFSPPQARLLRVLADRVRTLMPREDRRFELNAPALNQLLDVLSGSPFVTWGEGLAPDLRERAGVAPGDRVRLEDAAPDVVPVCESGPEGMRIALAVRWPDGRSLPFESVLYLESHDPLHPSLVLAEGAFWRVNEEPPRELLRRLRGLRGLAVPETGRARFLELLAASFSTVAEALEPYTRRFHARPVVAMELREDDWLHLRVFAHTGAEDWRPGASERDIVAFELAEEGWWERVEARDADSSALHAIDGPGSEREGGSPEAPPAGEEAGQRAPAPDAVFPGAAEGGSVLLEAPDRALVRPAQEWLATLPLARTGGRSPGAAGPPAALGQPGVWMRLNPRSLEAFAEAWDRRPAGVTYLGNRRMRELLGGASARPTVRVTSSGIDWFAVRADWEAEGLALTEADLARLRSARTRFVRLSSGWVRRERAEEHDATAEVLADLGIEAGAGEQRVSIWQLAQARPESLAALGRLGGDPAATGELERLRERVRSFAGLPPIPVPETFRGELRPYQREGLDFLSFVTGLGMGAILADDMGLGKTVQALAWIEHLRVREPGGGPVLVVCPASVVHNWVREAERFTPSLRVLALTSGQERHALRREVPDHDLVVTNYALLRRDLEQWKPLALRAVILDEAQNVKNPDAAVSRAVQHLQAKHRLALTGTPLENRALDLWSIMQFLNPGYLGSRKAFEDRYDRPDARPHARRLLAARLRPVLLRRLKSLVARELPDRIEERRDCVLTPGQRKLYLAELERGRTLIASLGASPEEMQTKRLEILAALTRMRQVCCHPALVGGRESLGSGKFQALFELFEPLLAEGHKVLVFSQFVELLKLLAAEMKRRGVRHHVLTGATTRREEVVAAFEADPEPCAFLISLRAGGTGLNLTAASYVVLFDPWWNPAVEAQAIDRTHRIGQTRTVIAYRMLAEGTVEERIWELQQRKAALARDVLGEDGFARRLSREDLDYLFARP